MSESLKIFNYRPRRQAHNRYAMLKLFRPLSSYRTEVVQESVV